MSGLTTFAIARIAAAIRFWLRQDRDGFGRATPAFVVDVMGDEALVGAWKFWAEERAIEDAAFWEPTEIDASTFTRWMFPELGL